MEILFVVNLLLLKSIRTQFLLPFKVRFVHFSSEKNRLQTWLCAFYLWQTGVSLLSFTCLVVLVNLKQTIIKQLMEAIHFLFHATTRVFLLAALKRDLHKAELLIASLQGTGLDSASHPFFHGKKKEILRNSSKRISAYAWSPLWSLSNKGRSFNLVATGALHYTWHAEILARTVSAPPDVPEELSDLTKFMNMTMNILYLACLFKASYYCSTERLLSVEESRLHHDFGKSPWELLQRKQRSPSEVHLRLEEKNDIYKNKIKQQKKNCFEKVLTDTRAFVSSELTLMQQQNKWCICAKDKL